MLNPDGLRFACDQAGENSNITSLLPSSLKAIVGSSSGILAIDPFGLSFNSIIHISIGFAYEKMNNDHKITGPF